MKPEQTIRFIEEQWEKSIVPALIEYIKIPNKSPAFDKQWEQHGYMDKAMALISNWCRQHALLGMNLDIIRLSGRTPLLFIDIPGQSDETVLLYGHLDKQPEMSGWDEDLGPWKPVLRGEKLYGRGAADDGYAAFASLTAIASLQKQQLPHARCVLIIEACEESGSFDLPFYIEALKERIGIPSLVICLDSGCGNYEQLWVTTSLRGLISGVLSIDVLRQGIHSGVGSGVVPGTFRILRQLLNRMEDEQSGNIIIDALTVAIPEERRAQAEKAAIVLSHEFLSDTPFLENVKAESNDIAELILRRTWKPALAVIGCNGLPPIEDAGNVTLPYLAVKLSLRLPPTVPAEVAIDALKKQLETEVPYDVKVKFTIEDANTGWEAPLEASWLLEATKKASETYFGMPAVYMGEGGSIPFMSMLGKKFPQAQFLITGVLGPGSNAHGPNEFLHLPTAKKLTACVAAVIAAHFNQHREN